ncbi:Uncharacterised protein [Actinomyces bovis]|uniref:DUF4232 domain-containing protein n=1 Tax=Actinomyces bovis TaxID=1658 RepID=A0ABY1VPV1_9ACTO|nr:DUF4232 domain-containing protein [Actinomyces bovis]SPT53949.1 Uncharacterised protein [Actinomyces bovis]VEG53465.1 Uncharacterised protein [Actinomyces israelii]
MSTRNTGIKIGAGILLAFSLTSCASNPDPAASTTPLASADTSSAAGASTSSGTATAVPGGDPSAAPAAGEAGSATEAAEDSASKPAAAASASAGAMAAPSVAASASPGADGADRAAQDKAGADNKDAGKKDSTALQDAVLCSTDNLQASLAEASSGGTDDSSYWDLKLTNNGKSACLLAGYPGVLLNDANGHTVGEPPAWEEDAETSQVLLEPGKSAVSTLRALNPEALACAPAESASALVYPPDLEGVLDTEARVKVCRGMSSMVVSPFRAAS